MVRIFRALGDPTRYRIVRVLMEREEVACRDLSRLFALSAPALSHHFRVLQECGLMRVRREGPYHFFRLNRPLLERALGGWRAPPPE
ncbi:MAG: metalloregulator ArsR/SmtB family transcription factor [Armatimonadota bacterium]|nr:metalloregulator ArsR/SmtB family transcription factor [Armatimonadota bacterium]MDR7402750.1 metalloregulator ArsR/SmtB family transcription factor [Armatimonadota bacterium]MDR7404487.1 metalloregulator ArsR/SmtB family transcription factor [Armatimonadota bacterium]MDR7437011.1 metalloregulator ArsR/SmtB family transcription factor [Armatimonadota bacterium]MDR7472918.1 metalloregulator ArsR/SmtB family transcription factor [Armatimonadota bacterium]